MWCRTCSTTPAASAPAVTAPVEPHLRRATRALHRAAPRTAAYARRPRRRRSKSSRPSGKRATNNRTKSRFEDESRNRRAVDGHATQRPARSNVDDLGSSIAARVASRGPRTGRDRADRSAALVPQRHAADPGRGRNVIDNALAPWESGPHRTSTQQQRRRQPPVARPKSDRRRRTADKRRSTRKRGRKRTADTAPAPSATHTSKQQRRSKHRIYRAASVERGSLPGFRQTRPSRSSATLLSPRPRIARMTR